MDADKTSSAATILCVYCHGPRVKGGAHGKCKRCYEGTGSGNTCEICKKPISRKCKHCRSCALKGKTRTQEHCDHIKLSGWSRKYNCCQHCGTTERRHFSKGLCHKCYRITWEREHPRKRIVRKIPDYKTYAWLHRHYEVEGLSVTQCAELVGVRYYVISRWLRHNGIYIDLGKGRRGLKKSEAWRADTSARMKGPGNHFYNRRGSLCIHWKGGISREPYPFGFDSELKQSIRIRDNHKCVLCGKNTPRLCVHHVDYAKDNLAPSNLVSLCPSCHSGTNSNRAYWQERLSLLVKEAPGEQ